MHFILVYFKILTILDKLNFIINIKAPVFLIDNIIFKLWYNTKIATMILTLCNILNKFNIMKLFEFYWIIILINTSFRHDTVKI